MCSHFWMLLKEGDAPKGQAHNYTAFSPSGENVRNPILTRMGDTRSLSENELISQHCSCTIAPVLSTVRHDDLVTMCRSQPIIDISLSGTLICRIQMQGLSGTCGWWNIHPASSCVIFGSIVMVANLFHLQSRRSKKPFVSGFLIYSRLYAALLVESPLRKDC